MSKSILASLDSIREIRSFLLSKLHEEKNRKKLNMDDYLRIQQLAEQYIPEIMVFNDQEHQLEFLVERLQNCWDDVRACEAIIFKWKYLSRADQRATSFELLQEGQAYELDPSGEVEIERLSLTRSCRFVALTFIGGKFQNPRTIAVNLEVLPHLDCGKAIGHLLADDLEDIAAKANELIMDLSRPEWVDQYIAYSDHTFDDVSITAPIQSFKIFQ